MHASLAVAIEAAAAVAAGRVCVIGTHTQNNEQDVVLLTFSYIHFVLCMYVCIYVCMYYVYALCQCAIYSLSILTMGWRRSMKFE